MENPCARSCFAIHSSAATSAERRCGDAKKHRHPRIETRNGVLKAIRDLSERFEHRLFLSATPYNGHSNSFSALLEMLDPQRFTRGVEV
jgi:hypothetical protein